MQYDDLDILQALSSVLRIVKETEKLSTSTLDKWPIYAATMQKCTEEEGKTEYQCQELNFSAAKAYYTRHYTKFCSRVTKCIQARLSWSSLQQLRDIVFVLATQGWQKAVDENDSLEAIDRLVQQFSIPLESAGADKGEIHSDFEAVLQYATMYISLCTFDYRAVWWRLFHAPCASEWVNILILAELLLSLPASNGNLERVFSQLNVIKSNKRTLLANDTLDDLLMVSTMNSLLKDFNPNKAIDLW